MRNKRYKKKKKKVLWNHSISFFLSGDKVVHVVNTIWVLESNRMHRKCKLGPQLNFALRTSRAEVFKVKSQKSWKRHAKRRVLKKKVSQ